MAEFLRTLKIDTPQKKLLAATAFGLVAYGGYRFFSSRRQGENAGTVPVVGIPSVAAPAVCAEPVSKFAGKPGLGDDEFPGFPADVVPNSMPDLSQHNSFMAEILRNNPGMWA